MIVKCRSRRPVRMLTFLTASVLFAGIGLPAGVMQGAEAKPWECNIPSSLPAASSEVSEQSGTSLATDGQLGGGEISLQCGIPPAVPNRLVVGGTSRINTAAFPVKTKTGYRENRGQAWSIEKDNAGHGGRAWKLKNPKGNRVASLAPDGGYLAP